MSFDLKLVNGDIVFKSNGNIDTVHNTEKLRQDVLKIILTPIGTNKNHLWYGCSISNAIGSTLDYSIVSDDIKESIIESLNRLKSLQSQQSIFQSVVLSELLHSIGAVNIEKDPFDPRNMRVDVIIYSKGLTEISESFTITL